MTQPEETTAALIARLHEELTIKEAQLANVRKSEAVHVDLAHKAYQERDRAKADLESSKAECLQWRKDIDIERAEVARLSRQLENTKGMLAERSGQSDGWFRACKQAEKELGEQLARAEKAEAELAHVRLMLQERTAMGDEYYAGKQRAENMLAERTREREEARAEALKVGLAGKEAAENCDAATAACRRAQRLAEEAGADCDRALRERDEAREQLGRVQADYQVFMLGTAHGAKCWADECGWHCAEGCKAKYARKCVAVAELKTAREQLAKLEWKGRLTDAGALICHACLLCDGADPSNAGSRRLPDAARGHRPTCWFAKKEAGANKIRNHRKDCPARSANDVAWVDSQWQVNGCRTAPIEGPRPRPIGCEGCKCAKPGAQEEVTHGAMHHPRLGWVKMQHVGRVNDLLKSGRLFIGCDFGFSDVAAFNVYRYACGADVGKKDATESDPARPEPRFKVGEKVVTESQPWTITKVVRFNCGPWWYEGDGDTRWQEAAVKPAPKFAVGEWVTLDGKRSGEVMCSKWTGEWWRYDIDAKSAILVVPEKALAAQTPQHKQCGAGYVFLGRMTNAIDTDWDLWFVKDGSPFVPGQALASDAGDEFHLASAGDKQTRPELVEARRRAVALGLVKP